jgi:riboflavin transporter FmnP
VLSKKSSVRLSRIVASTAAIAPIAILLAAPGAPEISFPLLPFLKFELWEIPVYFAFYFFGFRTALLTEVVVYAVVQTHPTTILFAPVYNLVAVLITLVGLRITAGIPKYSKPLGVGVSSALRAAVMVGFNYVFIQLPIPFGFSLPAKEVAPLLIPIAIFNVIVTLYSVGLALMVHDVVWKRILVRSQSRIRA